MTKEQRLIKKIELIIRSKERATVSDVLKGTVSWGNKSVLYPILQQHFTLYQIDEDIGKQGRQPTYVKLKACMAIIGFLFAVNCRAEVINFGDDARPVPVTLESCEEFFDQDLTGEDTVEEAGLGQEVDSSENSCEEEQEKIEGLESELEEANSDLEEVNSELEEAKELLKEAEDANLRLRKKVLTLRFVNLRLRYVKRR